MKNDYQINVVCFVYGQRILCKFIRVISSDSGLKLILCSHFGMEFRDLIAEYLYGLVGRRHITNALNVLI